MLTATKHPCAKPWHAGMAVYKLSKPAAYNGKKQTSYVAVSAVNGAFAHETYIFPCDQHGNSKEMMEMEGSYRGGTDHAKALKGLGYRVIL